MKGVLIFILIFLIPVAVYPQCRFLDTIDNEIICNPPSSWLQAVKPQLTIEVWVFLEEIDQRHIGIVNMFTGDSYFGVEYEGAYQNQLESSWSGTTGSNTYGSGGVTFTTGQWYHIAVSYNGVTRTHYVNGVVDGTPQADTGSTTGGGPNDFAVNGYVGIFTSFRVDEMRVWSYGRTQEQIQSNMDEIIADEEPGLEVYWRFDESTGGIFDRSGNGNDATTVTGTLSVDNAPIKRIIGE